MFADNQLLQISKKGIELSKIHNQIDSFKKGFPFMKLIEPATIENKYITKFSSDEVENHISFFEKSLSQKIIIKFVPASGAASRMFKSLFSFCEKYDHSEKAYQNFLADKSFNSVWNFISNIEHFAFYEDLKSIMISNNIDINKCIEEKNFNIIIDFLLHHKGLDYAALPKGLLKFHKYGDTSRTAIEEHLVEAVEYAQNKKTSCLHFTISPEHIEKFKELIEKELKKYESDFSVNFNISYSIQKSSTDTIAVDMDNNPFCEADGTLLFRPGGHGALIENLNELDADIVFIKNIDNVVPDQLKNETILYKKALAGYLVQLQQRIFNYLVLLENNNFDDDIFSQIFDFAHQELHLNIKDINDLDKEQKKKILFSLLNRPIRVCGMVKNEGEPGGGPFLVKNSKNEMSLQIVESSQINMNDTHQKEIFNNSTHFNPVDLICGIKDYKGNRFNLLHFIDQETGFISLKSKDGKDLKALELPGLWNGAMAEWVTIFVEVPIITFNPVKTVNDLLREEHQ